MSRHLLIGALPPPIGGTTVLFQSLVSYLKGISGYSVEVIDTAVRKPGLHYQVLTYLGVFFRLTTKVWFCDSVAFHGSINGVRKFTPLLRLITFLASKPTIVRTFGGDFDITYAEMNRIEKFLFTKCVMNSSLVLFETKQSVSYFTSIYPRSNIRWFPNSREIPVHAGTAKIRAKHLADHFVYIGRITKEKGLLDLSDAVKSIGSDVKVHLYGPLEQPQLLALLSSNIEYCGVIQPDKIADCISQYRALVLPTYYPGEGYPGVILEAYAVALPVITTKWRCIPEIVDET